MTPAHTLLADLRSRGIDLDTDGVRIRWRPIFMVTDVQAALIREYRAELIRLLVQPNLLERCSSCAWVLDASRRCPKCFDRHCVNCGKRTGSYLIMRCTSCGNAETETEAMIGDLISERVGES